MQKVKNKALEEIVSIDAFDNKEEFEQMARAYKSPKKFFSLKKSTLNVLRIRQSVRKLQIC